MVEWAHDNRLLRRKANAVSAKMVVPSCNNRSGRCSDFSSSDWRKLFSAINTNAGEEITPHHFGNDVFMSKLVSLSNFSKGRSAVINPKWPEFWLPMLSILFGVCLAGEQCYGWCMDILFLWTILAAYFMMHTVLPLKRFDRKFLLCNFLLDLTLLVFNFALFAILVKLLNTLFRLNYPSKLDPILFYTSIVFRFEKKTGLVLGW